MHMKHLSHEQFSALKSAERKMLWRVLLLNVLLMFVNYIDRTNLSFAAVQLNRDIGLDHQTYGLGAGGRQLSPGRKTTVFWWAEPAAIEQLIGRHVVDGPTAVVLAAWQVRICVAQKLLSPVVRKRSLRW
jgi:hypothetical protein